MIAEKQFAKGLFEYNGNTYLGRHLKNMQTENRKPVIGFSCGDLNGIGIETIIKVLSDNRIYDFCTPVVFANNKVINFYRKTIPDNTLSFQMVKDFTRLNFKQANIFTCWEEDVSITPGVLNETGGAYALKSLQQAVEALKQGDIHGLVTAPIHKKNIQSAEFNFSGHTPYLKHAFEAQEIAMILAAPNLKVALLTEHVPVKDVAAHVTIEAIIGKLQVLNRSLQQDFDISKPRMAVLGLNPHAGDEGLIGDEEIHIIRPALQQAREKGMLAYGPYSADAFFARGHYSSFDVVLALYHDQGLIPLKSLASGEAVNYTAGLPVVRTSPDHGTAFDIAGKGIAQSDSTMAALFTCIDILNQRAAYRSQRSNPVRKMSTAIVANARDEALED